MSDNLSNALVQAGFAPVASPVAGVSAFVGVGNGADHTAPDASDTKAPEAKPTRKSRVLAAKPTTPVADNAASDKAETSAPSQGAQSDAAALIGHLRAKRAHRTRIAQKIPFIVPSKRDAALAVLAEKDAEIAQLEKRVSRLPKAVRATATARDSRAGIAASVTRLKSELTDYIKNSPPWRKVAAKLAAAEAKLAALA